MRSLLALCLLAAVAATAVQGLSVSSYGKPTKSRTYYNNAGQKCTEQYFVKKDGTVIRETATVVEQTDEVTKTDVLIEIGKYAEDQVTFIAESSSIEHIVQTSDSLTFETSHVENGVEVIDNVVEYVNGEEIGNDGYVYGNNGGYGNGNNGGYGSGNNGGYGNGNSGGYPNGYGGGYGNGYGDVNGGGKDYVYGGGKDYVYDGGKDYVYGGGKDYVYGGGKDYVYGGGKDYKYGGGKDYKYGGGKDYKYGSGKYYGKKPYYKKY